MPAASSAAYSSVARGDTSLDEYGAPLPSPLPDASDEAWTEFVRVSCLDPQTGAPRGMKIVSESNALGAFEMMPRRLADLGLVDNLARRKGSSGRTVWVGRFILPMTTERFLLDPVVQYRAFAKSMIDYTEKLATGQIQQSKDPSMKLSGALAILHRGGPKGIKTWDDGERFSITVDAYERAKEIF